MSSGNGVTFFWGNRGVSARGVGVIFLLSVFAIVGSNMYSGWRIERAVLQHDAERASQVDALILKFAGILDVNQRKISNEHERMLQDIRILACITALSEKTRERVVQQQRVEWAMVCPGIMAAP